MQNKEWLMLDDEQWSMWEKMHLLDGKERLLRWGEIPSGRGEEVEALRILVKSEALTELPACVRSLVGLTSLELPRAFIEGIGVETLPPSLSSLTIIGQGQAKWPHGVTLPRLSALSTGEGVLFFERARFPGLTSLTLRIDKKEQLLECVGDYKTLTALYVTGASSNKVFEAAAASPLVGFGVGDSKLDDLHDVAKLPGLKRFVITSMPKLKSLEGVEALAELEELSISYCNKLEGLQPIFALKKLRRLDIVACRNIGVTANQAALDAMGLEHLVTSGSK